MEVTRTDRFRRACLKFGRKNKIAYGIAIALIAVSAFGQNLVKAVMSNGKKLGLAATSLCFLVVFNSFTFPGFGESNSFSGTIDFGEIDRAVSIAEVSELDAAEIARLEASSAITEEDSFEAESGDAIDLESFEASELLELVSRQEEISVGEESDLTQDKSVLVSESDNYEFEENDWRLILVNKQHFIPDAYEVELGTIKGSLQCDKRILEDLLAMLSAAGKDGISLTICSPYRTGSHQIELFERKIVRYMNLGMSYIEAYKLAGEAVTIPGTSEHEIGLALDIVCPTYTSLNSGFGDTEAGKWLAEHSYEYGFVLRYPKDKEYITTIEYEPWHYRYVGHEAAALMKQNGWTLEEFWEEMF